MRGYGQARWLQARALALRHGGYRCATCGATKNLRVHHRDGLGMTGPRATHQPNLIVQCESCHRRAHVRMMSDDERAIVVIPSYRRE
jgi:5-methylcytosine-specific restriction endonuclease McrA